MLRKGDRSKQWHQVNEIQMAKCDVFHSDIFCNTANQSPKVYSLWWASMNSQVLWTQLHLQGRDKDPKRLAACFKSFCVTCF